VQRFLGEGRVECLLRQVPFDLELRIVFPAKVSVWSHAVSTGLVRSELIPASLKRSVPRPDTRDGARCAMPVSDGWRTG
jgi:hypothetical protein